MNKPTTLLDIERALAEQDRHLDDAYRALAEPGRARAVELPAGAIERLEQACGAGPRPRVERRPPNGIRC
jgi:hypothetical protein